MSGSPQKSRREPAGALGRLTVTMYLPHPGSCLEHLFFPQHFLPFRYTDILPYKFNLLCLNSLRLVLNNCLFSEWPECPRPPQTVPGHPCRGAGETRSSRFSAVTEPSCLRAAKEDFQTSSVSARAIKCLQVLPRHSSGHCEKCQSCRQLIIPARL